MLSNLPPRQQYAIAGLGLALLFLCAYVGAKRMQEPPPIAITSSAPSERKRPQKTDEAEMATIYISGEVQKPGLYRTPDGVRVNDVLPLAGGTLPDADLNKVNLAQRVEDGMHIQVPAKKVKNEARASRPVVQKRGKKSAPVAAILNLNSASAQQLSLVPGISPDLAAKIVKYRSQVKEFVALDDLLAIPGMTPLQVDRLRPYLKL